MSNEKFKVKFGLAVGDTAATIDGTTGDIVTTGDLTLNGANISTGITDTIIEIDRTSSGTSAFARAAVLKSTSTGTPTTGFGTALGFISQTDATTFKDAGYISVVSTDTTTGSEDFDMRFGLMAGGAAYAAKVIIDSLGNLQLNGNLTVTGTNINTGVTNTVIEIDRTSTATATAPRALVLKSISTGTPAVGFGTSLEFQGQTDATTFKQGGYISINATDITTGSEDFEMGFGLMAAGAAYANKMTLSSIGDLTTAGDIKVGGNDIQASTGNTAITLVPITGYNPNVDFPGNIVKGAIRTGGGEATGDIYSLGGVGYTGVSVDNTDKVTDRTAIVMRNYGGSLASGNPRNAFIVENARGTAASPTNVTNGLNLLDIAVGGYTSTGWTGDVANTNPLLIRAVSTEAWSSGTSNVGVGFQVFAQPTATTLTTTSQTPILNLNPQNAVFRSDDFIWRNGKTGTTQTLGLDISGNLTAYGTITANGNNTFGTATALNATSNLTTASSAAGTTIQIQTNYRASSGATLIVPQNAYSLGNFRFNSYSDTAGTYVLGGSVQCQAAENFTSTANGTSISFVANKIGKAWNDTSFNNVSLKASPDATIISSDTISFQDSATSAVTYATIGSTTANFTVPVTTEITTTTISEGTTYTPAATVDNNISVQINTLAGGTTVIDLASLTGNSRGASYNILVFNNTASGTPIQVKNTRINSNNLMTHTITTGSPRIIINAYVVGDYATADHLVVA